MYFFRICVLPEGMATIQAPNMFKKTKCLDSIDCTMIFTISKCEFDVNTITDTYKHCPDLFWFFVEPKEKVSGPGAWR